MFLENCARYLQQKPSCHAHLRKTKCDPMQTCHVKSKEWDTIRHSNSDWTKLQLPDGREIGIASTDSGKGSDVGREFLLAEVRAGRLFTDKDDLSFQKYSGEIPQWIRSIPVGIAAVA